MSTLSTNFLYKTSFQKDIAGEKLPISPGVNTGSLEPYPYVSIIIVAKSFPVERFQLLGQLECHAAYYPAHNDRR